MECLRKKDKFQYAMVILYSTVPILGVQNVSKELINDLKDRGHLDWTDLEKTLVHNRNHHIFLVVLIVNDNLGRSLSRKKPRNSSYILNTF